MFTGLARITTAYPKIWFNGGHQGIVPLRGQPSTSNASLSTHKHFHNGSVHFKKTLPGVTNENKKLNKVCAEDDIAEHVSAKCPNHSSDKDPAEIFIMQHVGLSCDKEQTLLNNQTKQNGIDSSQPQTATNMSKRQDGLEKDPNAYGDTCWSNLSAGQAASNNNSSDGKPSVYHTRQTTSRLQQSAADSACRHREEEYAFNRQGPNTTGKPSDAKTQKSSSRVKPTAPKREDKGEAETVSNHKETISNRNPTASCENRTISINKQEESRSSVNPNDICTRQKSRPQHEDERNRQSEGGQSLSNKSDPVFKGFIQMKSFYSPQNAGTEKILAPMKEVNAAKEDQACNGKVSVSEDNTKSDKNTSKTKQNKTHENQNQGNMRSHTHLCKENNAHNKNRSSEHLSSLETRQIKSCDENQNDPCKDQNSSNKQSCTFSGNQKSSNRNENRSNGDQTSSGTKTKSCDGKQNDPCEDQNASKSKQRNTFIRNRQSSNRNDNRSNADQNSAGTTETTSCDGNQSDPCEDQNTSNNKTKSCDEKQINHCEDQNASKSKQTSTFSGNRQSSKRNENRSNADPNSLGTTQTTSCDGNQNNPCKDQNASNSKQSYTSSGNGKSSNTNENRSNADRPSLGTKTKSCEEKQIDLCEDQNVSKSKQSYTSSGKSSNRNKNLSNTNLNSSGISLTNYCAGNQNQIASNSKQSYTSSGNEKSSNRNENRSNADRTSLGTKTNYCAGNQNNPCKDQNTSNNKQSCTSSGNRKLANSIENRSDTYQNSSGISHTKSCDGNQYDLGKDQNSCIKQGSVSCANESNIKEKCSNADNNEGQTQSKNKLLNCVESSVDIRKNINNTDEKKCGDWIPLNEKLPSSNEQKKDVGEEQKIGRNNEKQECPPSGSNRQNCPETERNAKSFEGNGEQIASHSQGSESNSNRSASQYERCSSNEMQSACKAEKAHDDCASREQLELMSSKKKSLVYSNKNMSSEELTNSKEKTDTGDVVGYQVKVKLSCGKNYDTRPVCKKESDCTEAKVISETGPMCKQEESKPSSGTGPACRNDSTIFKKNENAFRKESGPNNESRPNSSSKSSSESTNDSDDKYQNVYKKFTAFCAKLISYRHKSNPSENESR